MTTNQTITQGRTPAQLGWSFGVVVAGGRSRLEYAAGNCPSFALQMGSIKRNPSKLPTHRKALAE